MKNCAKEKVSVSRYFRGGGGRDFFCFSIHSRVFTHSGRSRGTDRGPGGPGLPLLFDQTDARRAKKIFWTDSRDHISNHANLLEQKKAIMLQLIFFISVSFYFSFVFGYGNVC